MKLPVNRTVRIAIEIVVLAFLALLFLRVLDFQHLREYFSLITLQVIGGVLVFQVAILVLHTVQWDLILREAGIAQGLWKTFWARTSGFALTYLTPSMLFIGEPVRAALYKTEVMSNKVVYATIALDKYIELVTKLPCITAGFALLIILARPSMALIVACGALLAIFFAFFIFLMAKLFTSQTFIVGFFGRLARQLQRFSPRLAAALVRMVNEFSADLHAIIRRKKAFVLAMLAGIAITVIEVFQTFYILGVLGHQSLPHSFVIYATVLIQHVIAILPGNLGGMEATHLFIFNVLGIGSTRSFVYTIILRIGQLTMVLLGILHILFRRIRKVRARKTAMGIGT